MENNGGNNRMNKHKLHPMYGNAGHVFPRTVEEAFGPGETIFVHNEISDEDDEISAHVKFSSIFAIVVYTLAAIVVGVILLVAK